MAFFQVLWLNSYNGVRIEFDFRSGDKLVSVLRPLQLVEMRIGESEVRVASIKCSFAGLITTFLKIGAVQRQRKR